MKILYLIHQFYPEYYTGTEKIILNLARMMQISGNKVTVITYSFYKDSSYNQRIGNILFKEFIYRGIRVIALRHKKIPKDINRALDNKDMSKVATDLISLAKPDVVHVGHPMRVGELVKVLRHLNIPYIITLTDFFLICPKFTLITSMNTLCCGPKGGSACRNLCPEFHHDFITRRLKIAREILFHAKSVVSLSRFHASMFKKELQDLEIKIIAHGLRYSTLKRNEKNHSKGDRIVFCYTGSLNPHKGVHILIDAFKKVCSKSALLKIYGSGSEKSYIDRLMAMAKEDQRIEFCGLYSEELVGQIMENVDVIIIPSLWYETYCLVLHEALACNLPVIASDVGVMSEKIKDGLNGFLFKMGDLSHLKEVLQKLVDDPTILNTMKHDINRIVIPSVEQEACIYERAYDQIVREAANPTKKIDGLLTFR